MLSGSKANGTSVALVLRLEHPPSMPSLSSVTWIGLTLLAWDLAAGPTPVPSPGLNGLLGNDLSWSAVPLRFLLPSAPTEPVFPVLRPPPEVLNWASPQFSQPIPGSRINLNLAGIPIPEPSSLKLSLLAAGAFALCFR